MIRFLIFYSSLIFLSYNCNAQSRAEMGVGAIGLVVHDLEASEQFYTQILGMIEVGGFSLDKQWSIDAGAANNLPFGVKQYKQIDLPSALTIKLAYFDTPVEKSEINAINTSSGVNYVTLYYDLEQFLGIIDRAKAAQIEITGWVKRDTYQLAFIKDPNGIFIEIIGPPDK